MKKKEGKKDDSASTTTTTTTSSSTAINKPSTPSSSSATVPTNNTPILTVNSTSDEHSNLNNQTTPTESTMHSRPELPSILNPTGKTHSSAAAAEEADQVSSPSSENSDKPEIRVGQFPHPPQPRPSILHSKSIEGFLNLFGLLLVTWSGNIMYNNWRHEGYLIDFTLLRHLLQGIDYLMLIWGGVVAFHFVYSVTSEFLLIQYAQKKRLSPFMDFINCTIYVLAQLILFGVPSYLAFTSQYLSAMCRTALACQIVVNSFKMHSYFITNRYFREEMFYSGKYKENGFKPILGIRYEKIRLDRNLSKLQQFYLLAFDYQEYIRIPSLVYEINFPRTSHISFIFVIREYGGGLLICLFMYFIMQRYMAPLLGEIESYDWYDLIINLAIPSMAIWMLLFYCVFHCFLNATAELVRYADREFYLEWWNATSVSQYWRLWNRPVLKFMSRHIYVESMRRVKGFNKVWAALSTFFVTAVLHEYVLIMTFRVFRAYFFTMVIAQIPLFYVTEKLKGTRLGNVLLWFGYLLCFPVMELLYFRAALRENSM
ncbi:hypothetical protein FDP41_003766 [Naegleria fowleri]|uniref:O-acyltransferase n=1 Tax=Naegleria fowleri TaxID=5763 RepID=A0A6A5BGU6_NAEFO|nr:uncharacterized protein FDP41_003766 [Naegleria fowleri]KAF0977113.1 hypothetical protein FDP41_003766 [Naegleria fowleri]